jgi:putative nucleotidyltransferase with HDIG domain
MQEMSEVRQNGGVSTPLADGAPFDEAALLELEGEGAGVLGDGREPWLARLAGRMGRHHAALMLLSTLLLWLVIAFPSLHGSDGLEVGKPAAHDVVAPITTLVPDRDATADRRREAAALVPPVYTGNPRAQEQALSHLHARLQREPSALSALSATRRELVARAAADAIRAVYRRTQIRSDVATDLEFVRKVLGEETRSAARRLKLSAAETERALVLAQQAARVPNLIRDERATHRARRDAQNQAPAIYERVQSGDVLVQSGEIVTAAQWEQLQELNLASMRPTRLSWNAPFWQHVLAQAALCALLILLASAYLATLDRSLLRRPAALWLAAMTPILFLAFLRFMLRVPHADMLLIPLAATAAILLTILLEARIGILTALMIAAPGVLMAHGDAGLFLSAAISAWIGALSVANITSRRQIAHSGLLLVATNALLALIFGVLRDSPFEQILSLMLWSGVSGVFAVIAGSGLAMALERPFGITTHLHLLELLAPDELVLRRLQTEAPGTYTHSLMVSLLAEAAAKEVEADSLLCRVGGLYHDIGKLRRPHCFVENQSGENIHDRLSPQLSARVIVAHVHDGFTLGRALKLPQPILDIISQHHGTSRVEYFYRQAVQQCEVPDARLALCDVNEDEFRYPGPRPQNKETAIVMLADTVEASSRALPQPTLDKLTHHVQAMIGQKLREGELAECDLTLRDLQKVQDSFLHVLRGALHQRIEYPTALGEEKNGDAENAGGEADELAEMTAQLKAPKPKTSRRARKARRAKANAARNGQAQQEARETQLESDTSNGAQINRVQQALAESFLGRVVSSPTKNGGAHAPTPMTAEADKPAQPTPPDAAIAHTVLEEAFELEVSAQDLNITPTRR